MESWFQRGRPALFEALKNACESIDQDFQSELRLKKSQVKDAGTSTVGEDIDEKRDAVIDKLERENAELRKQLATPMPSPNIHLDSLDCFKEGERDKDGEEMEEIPDSNTSSLYLYSMSPIRKTSNLPPYNSTVDHTEFTLLQIKFGALSDDVKSAKEALEKTKDELEKWSEHAKFLEKKIRAAEDEHGIRILGHREGKHSTNFTSTNEALDLESTLPPFPSSKLNGNRQDCTTDDAHLLSTQGDPEEDSQELPVVPAHSRHMDDYLAIKQEPSSDMPVMVSERVLKRRKTTEISRIKVEESDRSPVFSNERYDVDIQDSMDLGEIAQKMATPRKRKEYEELIRQDESPLSTTVALSPKRLFVRPDQLQSPSKLSREATALTPISGNKRPAKQIPEKLHQPSLKHFLAHGISLLAEDGGFYGKDSIKKQPRSFNTPNSAHKGRLNALLNSPAAEANSPISRSIQTPQSKVDLAGNSDLGIPERRALPFERSVPLSNKRKIAEAGTSPQLSMREQKTPLRDKSPQRSRSRASTSALRRKNVSELHLEDFRINPQSNEGHDFAYSEVVRDKDERACLRGCTDMHCCGQQFRALALSQKPNPPLTGIQRQEEQKLLEKYLGDYAYRLSSMTKEERAELWIEAKTEELANKYGRHRHRFSRMQSPPGFWNADFPNTQELEEDREEASKREKRVIMERYREAMRPGGRWLFRDE